MRCSICKEDKQKVTTLELSISYLLDEKRTNYIEPLKISICEECKAYEKSVINKFYKLFQEELIKEPDYAYVIWCDLQGTGLVRNEDGGYWFSYNDAIATAKNLSKINNCKAYVQKGSTVWSIDSKGQIDKQDK